MATADRCKETTTTTGTGNITLLGAVSQFQAFATAFPSFPATVSYAIVGQSGTQWEVGIGTLTNSTTLQRTTVQDSSNAGSAVNFSAGTKDVFATVTAQDLEDITTALAGKAASSHTHAIADTTGLQTALDGKAASSHTHAIGDVTNLQTTLDGKAASSHTHAISDTTGLQTALDGKAASSHTHAIGDVTGLQTALDGKAASSHTHAAGDITSGTVATARLGSGTADSTTFLRGDGTWAAPGGGGSGDVAGPASAVDSRIAAFDGTTGKLLKDGGSTIANVLDRANHTGTQSADSLTDGTTNKAYTATEKTKLAGIASGAEVNVNADWNSISGDSQILNKPTLGGAATLNVGTTAGTVAAGDDSRLSDSRTPTAHATSHQSGGSDAIKLDDLATPDDNTDLDATTVRHGLLPKLGGGTTNFLRADGTWSAPAGGGGVSDGDKGDITVSASGATWTIDNDAVTYAKMQNVSATSRVLGRKAAGSGDTEECTLSEVLDFVGSAAQGDILYRGASNWTRLAAGTSGHYLKTLGSGANPAWAAVSGSATTDNKLYTADATWTNPSPSVAKRVFVRLVGGGGGGGSGRKGAAGSVRTGGSGGGTAGVVEFWCLTTDLGSTESVVIGAGGTGGSAITANSTNGSAGTPGGDTTFSGTRALGGSGGNAGGTGAAGAITGKTCVQGISTTTSGNSGASSATGAAGTAGADATTSFIPTGGGGGGGITSGDATSSGGRGGNNGSAAAVLAVDGGALGTAGNAGGAGASARGVGTGGGGGGSSITGNGGSGGAGGGPGAGGGGGGAATDSVGDSGAGGAGFAGYALIITFL